MARGLKLGVIGVGIMGLNHARTAASLPGVQLVGLADQDEAKAKQLGVQFGIPVYTNHQDLLPNVDAAIIASPTSTHFQVAQDCLNSGKHILVEKPLTGDLEQAQQIADLANEKNLVLAIGLIERFNPAFTELQKLIRKEKLIGIHAVRFSPFPARISDADVVQDMMVHDLDLLLTLIPNEEIESLKAEGKKIKTQKLDKVSATLFYQSGLLVKVEADRVFGIKSRKITVTTDRALFEADLLNKRVYIRDMTTHVPTTHTTKNQDQLTAEQNNFVKAIKNNLQPAVSAESMIKTLKLAEEVTKACS